MQADIITNIQANATTKAHTITPETLNSSVISKIHPEEKITAISPGQVFVTQDDNFVAQPCWLLFCEYIPSTTEDYPDDVGDYLDDPEYCIPLLPKEYENITEVFIRRRFQHCFDIEFMEKQGKTYRTNLSLKKFLQVLPSFSQNLKLNAVMQLIHQTASDNFKQTIRKYLDEYDSSQTQFYITTDPNQNMLLLCFEQNCWRPHVYCFKSRKRQSKWCSNYSCLLELYASAPNISSFTTEEYFEDCTQDTIDAFNQGATNLAEVQNETGAPREPNSYLPTDHARKVTLVPTFWYQAANIELSYDFLGHWHTQPSGKQISLNLGAFRAWHAVGFTDKGILTSRSI